MIMVREKVAEKNVERRTTERFPFVANAEVSDAISNTKIKVRVSEISMNGCYLDMINPFPVGTRVLVKIFTETDKFEAGASVIYSHPNLGVGLVFREISGSSQTTLQKWLMSAMGAANGTS